MCPGRRVAGSLVPQLLLREKPGSYATRAGWRAHEWKPGLRLWGGTLTQVTRCWAWQSLTFPQESTLVPPAFGRTVAGLCLQEAQRGPQEAQGPGAARRAGSLRAHTLPGPLLSHFPTEERGSSQRPGGHLQSLWTWSQWPRWTEEVPAPGHLPRGAAGTQRRRASSSCVCPRKAPGRWPETHQGPRCARGTAHSWGEGGPFGGPWIHRADKIPATVTGL